MIHRAAAALSRRAAALAAPSSRGVTSVAARAAATSARGVATTSSPNTAAVSFAEGSAIAPSANGGYCRNFSTAAADADDGSPWTDFPMAPPDPIIGLTEVRCMRCIFAVQQTCHFWHNKICAS